MLVVVVLSGCDWSSTTPVIGFAFPSYGAANVAVAREILRRHDVDVEIVYDSSGSSDLNPAAMALAERLAGDPEIVGVVGHGGSRNTLAAAPIYVDAGLPLLVPSATSRALGALGAWVFTLVPNDSVEGDFIAEYVTDSLQASRVVIFYVMDEYGAGLSAGVQAGLRSRNVTFSLAPVRTVTGPVPRDFSSIVESAVRDAEADVAVLAVRDPAMRQMLPELARHSPGLHVVAGDGVVETRSPSDWIPPGLGNVAVVSFWNPASPANASREFVSTFTEITGREPSPAEALRHDAIMVLARAAVSGNGGRGRVRRYLASLGHGRPAIEGVTGTILFPPEVSGRLVVLPLLPPDAHN